MKQYRLYKNKGFTLIECVIAVAVFAVMTAMVLMILAMAITTQKQSMDAEEELNKLVSNVVQDETNRRFGPDSHTLMMKVGTGGDGFSMTYNSIDGYKNYIKCPYCTCDENNTEFMGKIYETAAYQALSDAEKRSHKISYYFGDASYVGNTFTCPDCGQPFTESHLLCRSCGNRQATGGSFSYDNSVGSFYCNSCYSTNVVDETSSKAMSDNVAGDTPFVLSGLQANAIKYGSVEKPDDTEKKALANVYTSGSATSSCNMTITYTPNPNSSKPGKYKLSVTNLIPSDTSLTSTVELFLPPLYVPTIVSYSTSIATKVGVSQSEDITDNTKQSKLYIRNVPAVVSSFDIEFTLTNYQNLMSFEYDYEDKVSTPGACALTDYWLQWSGTTHVPLV